MRYLGTAVEPDLVNGSKISFMREHRINRNIHMSCVRVPFDRRIQSHGSISCDRYELNGTFSIQSQSRKIRISM
jgi:hypothetical protein